MNKRGFMYKVIIVEDDPMVSMINRHYVEQDRRFSVVQCFRSGNEALTYLQENSVDLVILDVYMPGMDGLSLLKKIRMDDINTDIIMVTASNDKKTLDNILRFGVIDYLVKPFVQERFQQALEKYIEFIKSQENISVLNQKNIDDILCSQHDYSEIDIPKGIQTRTLNKVKEYLKRHTVGVTAEQVADNLKISRVTIRKYMKYLLKIGEISEALDYETGGRPRLIYSLHR